RFACNRFDQGIGEVMLDQILEWRAAVGTRAENHAEPARLKQVLCASARVSIGELVVPFGSQKRIGGDQRAGADSSDDREAGSHLRACKSDQSTRPERAVGS